MVLNHHSLWYVNAEARVLPPMVIFKRKVINQASMNSAHKEHTIYMQQKLVVQFGMWLEKIFLTTSHIKDQCS